MKTPIKSFNAFVNESKDKSKTFDLTLEFDWTRADQMTKKEAQSQFKEDLDKLPQGCKLIGKPEFIGWGGRSRREPEYHKPYQVEIRVELTCPESKIKSWARQHSLDLVEMEEA